MNAQYLENIFYVSAKYYLNNKLSIGSTRRLINTKRISCSIRAGYLKTKKQLMLLFIWLEGILYKSS